MELEVNSDFRVNYLKLSLAVRAKLWKVEEKLKLASE